RRVDRLLAAQTDLLRSLDEARGSEVRQELNGIEQVGLAHRVRARNARVRTKIDDDPAQILESVDLQTREHASSLSHHTDALPGHVSASAPAVHSSRQRIPVDGHYTGPMDSRALLTDLAQRPLQELDLIWDSIDAAHLNSHPAGHPNSIAWLLWHTGREIDLQVAHASGRDQVWTQDWADRM